jgi:hypothetical protein
LRERFARCLVLRQRNQALHRPSELARGNDETWPDGFAGWTTARTWCTPLAQPWVGGGSKRGSRAASAEPALRDRGGATCWRRPGLWLVADLLLPASGSGCGLLGLCRIATEVTANWTAPFAGLDQPETLPGNKGEAVVNARFLRRRRSFRKPAWW